MLFWAFLIKRRANLWIHPDNFPKWRQKDDLKSQPHLPSSGKDLATMCSSWDSMKENSNMSEALGNILNVEEDRRLFIPNSWDTKSNCLSQAYIEGIRMLEKSEEFINIENQDAIIKDLNLCKSNFIFNYLLNIINLLYYMKVPWNIYWKNAIHYFLYLKWRYNMSIVYS